MKNGGEDDIRRALGTVCFTEDVPITGPRSKLAQVMKEGGELDAEKAAWMALAFCFDLVRRVEHIYVALRPFGENADPEIVRRVAEENDRLAELGQDYRSLAETLEEMIITLAEETEDDHRALRDKIL